MSDTAPEIQYFPPLVIDTPAPRPRRLWLHLGLFLATVASTLFVGAIHDTAFRAGLSGRVGLAGYTVWDYVRNGSAFSATLLGILGVHELGHYVACRYYGLDASLPYFIPFPLLSFIGTLGAFIKIRSPIRDKRILFDVGVAGPIAGFVVAVPALALGLALSNRMAVPPDFQGFILGEPLIFKLAARLVVGPLPSGVDINMHPMAFAAWFGMLATCLNLFPIGQLDGGHVAYAVFGRKAWWISRAMFVALVPLAILSWSWLFWAAVVFALGLRHFRTVDEESPLDPARRLLALFALIIFIVTFTPSPIRPT